MDPQVGIKIAEILKASGTYLTPRFLRLYTEMIQYYTVQNSVEISKIEQLRNEYIHPHYIVNEIRGVGLPCYDQGESKVKVVFTESPVVPIQESELQTNSRTLSEYFSQFKCSFTTLFTQLAPITTGALYLERGTLPRMLFIDRTAFVIVKASPLSEYYDNYRLITSLIKDLRTPAGKPIRTVDQIGLIREGGTEYFISEFRGFDYESEIIESGRNDLVDEMYEAASTLENMFLQHSIFFRNLAPRNIIHGFDGTIYLIDFDHTYFINQENLLRIYLKSLNRKVWFADMPQHPIRATLLASVIEKPSDSTTVAADEFESLFFEGKKLLTLQDQQYIYGQVAKLEQRGEYNGEIAYGHILGRFISDFWNVKNEVGLLKFISKNPDSIDTVRNELYKRCLQDQELLMKHSYGIGDKTLKLVSEEYFTEYVQPVMTA